MLSLAEDLLLLTLDDEKGTEGWHHSVHFSLPGAMIADLVLQGRLKIENGTLLVADATPTGDDLLDALLARVSQSRRPRRVQHWVASLTAFQRPLIDRLVQKGILRRERRRFLRLIPYDTFPTEDPREEYHTKEDLRLTILGNAAPDARTAALLALADECGVLSEVVSRDELKAARPRLREIAEGDAIGKSVQEAIRQTRAAVAAAAAATAAAAAS